MQFLELLFLVFHLHGVLDRGPQTGLQVLYIQDQLFREFHLFIIQLIRFLVDFLLILIQERVTKEHVLVALIQLTQVIDIIVMVQRTEEFLFQYLRVLKHPFELGFFLRIIVDFEHFIRVLLLLHVELDLEVDLIDVFLRFLFRFILDQGAEASGTEFPVLRTQPVLAGDAFSNLGLLLVELLEIESGV